MRPLRNLLAAVLGSPLALLLVVPSAHATWPNDPTVNVGVCNAANEQRNPAAVADGAGGVIVAWEDQRLPGNINVFVQRVSSAGTPLWGNSATGLVVCNATNSQTEPVVCGDGAGGVFVAWGDLRSGVWALYAQHVSAAGAIQWTANGIVVGSTLAYSVSSTVAEYSIATDTQGGAYIVWATSANEVRIQRLNGAGTSLFAAGGVVLENTHQWQYYLSLVPDGSGGAIACWQGYLSGQQYDILGQRVSTAGAALWAAGGVGVCTTTQDSQLPFVAADGTGGAVFAWTDYRAYPAHGYAQHVAAGGSALWTANGIPVGNPADQTGVLAIAGDGAGGAILAYSDYGSVNAMDAQRLNYSGVALWGTNGYQVSASPQYYGYGTLISDGVGGAIFGWVDNRNGNTDIYAQRLTASGYSLWNYNGVGVCTQPGSQVLDLYDGIILPLVSDGAGGAIFAWEDLRADAGDIYTQRVERFGKLGNPEPVITRVSDVLADQGGQVSLQWTASYLDVAPTFEVADYSIWREAPAAAAQAAIRGGARLLAADGPAGTSAPGVRRFLALPSISGTIYWEYLATVPARALPGYSHVTATTTDSSGSSNLLTNFMVMAEDYGGNPFWASAPDSGYSVDNLPPGAPAPFAGAYLAGATYLHWGANAEPDLAGYRLYRGASAGFVPGPGNLVSAQPDTGYVDAGPAGQYYKLSAVDLHGNESRFALLAPTGTLDAGTPGRPHELALAEPYPNPARERTTIAFELPRPATVRVGVYGVDGRLERLLSAGRLDAGGYALPFDLGAADGRAPAAGLYFVRLEAEGRSLVRRLVIVP